MRLVLYVAGPAPLGRGPARGARWDDGKPARPDAGTRTDIGRWELPDRIFGQRTGLLCFANMAAFLSLRAAGRMLTHCVKVHGDTRRGVPVRATGIAREDYRPAPNRDVVVMRWQGSTPDYSPRTRYPMPIRATPRRHPAFPMMTETAASAQAVTLDRAAAGTAGFHFTDEGDVRSASFAGTRWISEGDVKIDIDGKTKAHPWRDFAKAADWTPPHEPAPPLFEEHHGD